ncbi:MAG: response regulator [Anaerolineae bacterium]|nr:response regulator [Anaerolineae bacterium]
MDENWIKQNSTGQVEILIADRDKKTRSALKLMVLNTHKRAVITEAASANDLQRLAVSNPFDIALVDWDLTRNNGNETLISLLKDCQPGLVIIALSARVEDQAAALELGADTYVYKGDLPENLHRTLQSYLDSAVEQTGHSQLGTASCSHAMFRHYIM